MSSILFKGGRLVDPVQGVDEVSDVYIDNGAISEISKATSNARVIDVDGLVICPSFVDMHVHLREPGREDEETIASGSAAATAGGFTAVCAMPNTDPVCDNAAVADKVAAQGRAAGLCEVIPAGSLTKDLEGTRLSAIGEMVRSNARVRLFTDDGKGVQDARLLRRAMEYIRGFDAICAEHCEDAALSEGGQMHEGEFSDLLGLKGVPPEAEEIALARDLALARLTGVRFHALHVSTAGSVELIRRAKEAGTRVTAEATPHHASLSDAELVSFDTNFKVNPPLRTLADIEAIREGLADGTIDAIATDHAPHSAEEKESEFELAPPGMLGLETALAVVLTDLVGPGLLTPAKAIELMSCNPARILGLDGHGGPLAPGSTANLTVFDPTTEWTVDASTMQSLSRNSPWQGRTLKGKVLYTVFNGNLVLDEGRIDSEVMA